MQGDAISDAVAKPHLLLSRAHLPLSYLGTSGQSVPEQLPRFLKLCDQKLRRTLGGEKTKHDPKVAIVSLGNDEVLYALEHVQEDVHAVCPLHERVTLDNLRSAARHAPIAPRVSSRAPPKSTTPVEWWSQLVVQPGPLSSCIDSADRQSCGPHQVGATMSENQREVQEVAQSTSTAMQVPIEEDSVKRNHHDSPEEIQSSLVTQYLDALYRSKSSLAYFSKGPLSRARVESNFNKTSSKHGAGLRALVENMQTMILKSSAFDRKYRERLPGIIRDQTMPEVDTAILNISSKNTARRRERKAKAMKPNKNGVYAIEKDYIVNWWLCEDEAISGQDHATLAEQRLSQLKARESLLQLLLLVEMAAIENDPVMRSTKMYQGQKLLDVCETVETPEIEDAMYQKRAKQNNAQLDLLVDRLCIWQSVVVEGAVENKVKKANAISSSEVAHPSADPGKSDWLKEFCVDVLMPL